MIYKNSMCSINNLIQSQIKLLKNILSLLCKILKTLFLYYIHVSSFPNHYSNIKLYRNGDLYGFSQAIKRETTIFSVNKNTSNFRCIMTINEKDVVGWPIGHTFLQTSDLAYTVLRYNQKKFHVVFLQLYEFKLIW